jgi:hypothetical protein
MDPTASLCLSSLILGSRMLLFRFPPAPGLEGTGRPARQNSRGSPHWLPAFTTRISRVVVTVQLSCGWRARASEHALFCQSPRKQLSPGSSDHQDMAVISRVASRWRPSKESVLEERGNALASLSQVERHPACLPANKTQLHRATDDHSSSEGDTISRWR